MLPPATTSYYELTTDPVTLDQQGEEAGRHRAEGIVILDFGRPAQDGPTYGMMGYRGGFLSLGGVARAVESYVRGYFRAAPSDTILDVAIGTNNSCAPGQPCGAVPVCGCPDEPYSLVSWGGALAATVQLVGRWAVAERALNGFTDQVRVVAADDAEPAFDPGYYGTYDVLYGYAAAVGGTEPAMVDYGSAEPDYWTDPEILQVAYGFRPDVPMPQIYQPAQAREWAQLLSYAKSHLKEPVDIYGVLAAGDGSYEPEAAYAQMLGTVSRLTNQDDIPWLSAMSPWPLSAPS